MNETEFRHQLFDLAEDAPSGPAAAPALLRRARRRAVLTITSSVAIAVLVVGMGIAGVRALQTAPTPADPPTPTPGGLGSLAYEGDGGIYVADWDGSNPVRITDGRPTNGDDGCGSGGYAEGSIWSPDGRYLAYWHQSCEVGSGLPPGANSAAPWGNVIISDPDGNVVASFPGQGWLISWSPDSRRVAVWVRWGETIGIYGLDGERQAVLTLPPGMMAPGDFDPVWLPDGESLMVPYGVEIPLDGSTPRKLPWADRHEGWATYSPDGSRVAYYPIRCCTDNANGSLVVAAPDGSHPQEVSGDWTYGFGNPVWSPTGDRIAFTSGNSFSGNNVYSGTELRVVDLATGTVTLLVETDGSDVLRVLDFSPEGDRILFSRSEVRDSNVSSLWSINADGSNPRRLVTGTFTGDWQSPSQTP